MSLANTVTNGDDEDSPQAYCMMPAATGSDCQRLEAAAATVAEFTSEPGGEKA
jgi:hypothetical protein